MTVRQALTMFGRAMVMHCPNCGQSGIFHHWLQMSGRCPRCGLYFEREEGYWSGAVAINTVVTELIFAAVVAAVVIATWPAIPMVPLLVGGLALNAAIPVVFYPVSKTLWVATDLLFHPLEQSEQMEVERLRYVRDRASTLEE